MGRFGDHDPALDDHGGDCAECGEAEAEEAYAGLCEGCFADHAELASALIDLDTFGAYLTRAQRKLVKAIAATAKSKGEAA